MSRSRFNGLVQTRRNMLKTALAITATGRLAISPFPARAQQGSRRQGIAICVGLTQIDRTVYGTDGALQGPGRDADDMAALAERMGCYGVVRLKNDKATIGNVRDCLKVAAAQSLPGDFVLFYYSGHGSHHRNDNPVVDFEKSGEDQTLCLFNNQWVDDERGQLFMRFARNVRVLMVNDCCFSQSQAKVLAAVAQRKSLLQEHKAMGMTLGNAALERRIQSDQNLKAVATHVEGLATTSNTKSIDFANAPSKDLGELTPGRPKALDDSIAFELSKKPLPGIEDPDSFDMKVKSMPTGQYNQNTSAFVYSLSACSDFEQALDGNPNSLFTDALKRVYESGRARSYKDLLALTQQMLAGRAAPRPTDLAFGNGTDFSNDVPFQL